MSSLDKENEPFSIGRSETQNITRSEILQLRLRYFGHAMAAKGSLEYIMLGQVARYRRQVKPRMRWLDSIKEATGL